MTVSAQLRFIQLQILKLQRLSFNRSKFWLLILSFIIFLSLLASTKLKMLLSIDDLIDPDFRTFPGLTHLNSAFSDKNNLLLVVAPRDPKLALTKEELCGIQKWIFTDVDGNFAFRRIVSTFGVRAPEQTAQSFSAPPILDLHCEKNLDADALDLSRKLRAVQQTPWGGIMTSKSANDITLSFYLNDTATDKRFGSFDMMLVKQVMDGFKTKVQARFPNLETHWVGMAAYQYYLKQGFDQTGVLNGFMAILILFLFWAFFASVRTGGLFLLTIIVASILIYGAMAIFGCPIDVLTNTLTLMLVLSSLEDFLFIVHENQKSGSHWRKSFRTLLMPGFFTSLTTAIGFGSLATSNLGIIRRFGLFAGFAALLEWAIVFLALPAFLQYFPRFRAWLTPPKSARVGLQQALEKIGKLHIPRVLAWGLACVYLLSAFGVTRLHVTDAPTNIFPTEHPATKDLHFIESSRDWQSEVSLVFKNYHQTENNRQILKQVAQLKIVSFIESPYAIEDYLRNGVDSTNSRQMIDFWKESDGGARLISSDGTARAILYLKQTDTGSIDQLEKEVQRICPQHECEIAGSLVSYAEFGNRVLSTLLESLALSLVLVSIVLIFLLKAKKQKHVMATLISAMWGPVSLISIFWIAKLPVTYVTSTFASILVGLAGDNTIQYLFGDKKGSLHEGVNRQAGASVQVALMMMVLSCVLFGSYFAPLKTLGLLFITGFALTLIGDLWIFKGLLSRKH